MAQRIALLADIHANLPALDAVLADIGIRNVDAIYHLGDLVGYAANPTEVIWRIRERGIHGVGGNYDTTVAAGHTDSASESTGAREAVLARTSFEFTQRTVSPSARRLLGALPFQLDIRPLGGHRSGPRLVLVHGTPALNTDSWHERRSDEFCLDMAALANLKTGDVMACGHTHLAWHRQINGIHFVNAGSVGRPKDGNWFAGYALLDFAEHGPSVRFIRVDYDIAAAVGGIRSAGLPEELAVFLETGGRTYDRDAPGRMHAPNGGV